MGNGAKLPLVWSSLTGTRHVSVNNPQRNADVHVAETGCMRVGSHLHKQVCLKKLDQIIRRKPTRLCPGSYRLHETNRRRFLAGNVL